MKTNKEIVSKIREMIDAEAEKIDDLSRELFQLKASGDAAKAAKTQRKITRHYEVWSALLDLHGFANAD